MTDTEFLFREINLTRMCRMGWKIKRTEREAPLR